MVRALASRARVRAATNSDLVMRGLGLLIGSLRARTRARNRNYWVLRITVPGVDGSADHLKPSINASESSAWSLVSQIAMRSVIVSPGTTLPLVVNQPVAPPLRLFASHIIGVGSSNPVAARSSV